MRTCLYIIQYKYTNKRYSLVVEVFVLVVQTYLFALHLGHQYILTGRKPRTLFNKNPLGIW